jgi:PAS domain S-box-containing protein
MIPKESRVRPNLSLYAIVLNVLLAAVALRIVVDPFLGGSLALVTLFGAVAAAVYWGGYRAAVLVAALGYVACHFLFLSPRGVFDLSTAKDIVGLTAYVVSCAMMVGIGGAMRRVRDQASEQGELLYITLASTADAVITTDREGRVTFLNAAAEELIGWTNREAVGHPLDWVFCIVDEVSGEPLGSPALHAFRENKAMTLPPNAALITKDGARRPIAGSASPTRDRNGNVAGCVLVFRDLSAERTSEHEQAEVEASTRLLDAIVASSDDAIISRSLDGTIQSWNAAAERLFGYSQAEALGTNISLIIPRGKLEEDARVVANLRAGTRHVETERVHRNGHSIHVALTISALRDRKGNVVGACAIARDMTDRRRVGFAMVSQDISGTGGSSVRQISMALSRNRSTRGRS